MLPQNSLDMIQKMGYRRSLVDNRAPTIASRATRVRYRRYPGCASKSDGNIELAREVVLMNCKPITNADGIEEQNGPTSVKEDHEAEVPDNFSGMSTSRSFTAERLRIVRKVNKEEPD
ncbi:uncharacterized protein LOC111259415 [Varroa jacobsoni]|uniref:uncharacterized protein LOC111259415 n=1 Tax=Varroa jacobsoni TaxID=62625 RepID=UPI000BF8EBD3|nr:uncharacterized protein LOC111259415 [Varroa jacobsoni]